MATGNPYTEVTISGYNPNQPTNDGQVTAANTVDWDKHKDELSGPVKTALESTQSNITSALDKRIMNNTLTKTGDYTVVLADRGKDIRYSAASSGTFTLPAVADAKVGFELLFGNDSALAGVIINASGAELVGGLLIQTIFPGEHMTIYCDGSEWNITSYSKLNGVLASTANFTIPVSYHGRVFDCDASGGVFTMTLPAVASARNGFSVSFKKNNADTSANAITIDADGTETIDGALTATLSAAGRPITLVCDGTEWHILSPTALQLSTEQATTSGTSIDFTDVPVNTKRVTIMLDGVSTSGTSPPMIQLGDAGGFEATGYTGSVTDLAAGNASSNYSTGALLRSVHAAAIILHGSIVITLEDSTANTWIFSGVLGRSDAAGTALTAGSKSLSAALTQVRLTTVGGADTFDAGAVNVLYE